uniref:DnaJ subfamily B member 5 n=1 Tax=Lygus hesperus TaxID=30085 RepID=A0A0A9Z7D6_LYGHE
MSSGVEKKLFEVKILPGYKKGTKIRFEHEGGRVSGYPPNVMADLIFVLDEKPHPRFQRHSADLHTSVHVNLKTALLGGSVDVKGIDGQNITIPLNGISNNGRKLRVKGVGILDRKTNTRGDLYVTIQVQMPEKLNDETRMLVEKCHF